MTSLWWVPARNPGTVTNSSAQWGILGIGSTQRKPRVVRGSFLEKVMQIG